MDCFLLHAEFQSLERYLRDVIWDCRRPMVAPVVETAIDGKPWHLLPFYPPVVALAICQYSLLELSAGSCDTIH